MGHNVYGVGNGKCECCDQSLLQKNRRTGEKAEEKGGSESSHGWWFVLGYKYLGSGILGVSGFHVPFHSRFSEWPEKRAVSH